MEISFGEKIKMLREESELNQTQLGEKVQMTQRKISYIECSKCEPSIDDIRIFCKFFYCLFILKPKIKSVSREEP